MTTGLVMEGGAMRGMFTSGVIDVFMENGITFDMAVGVSAGATFGINYKSHQIGRPLRYNMKYCKDKRYASVESLIKTGDLYNAEFCYKTLPWELDLWDVKAFHDDPMVFYCVVTDAETGKPVYYNCKRGDDRDILWIRASASIPAASNPVEIDGRYFLDGGISDSIPLEFMERRGCDKIVVIETQPLEYRKTKLKIMPAIKVLLHKYPNMIRAMETRPERYNKQKAYIRKREEEGAIVVLRPEAPLNIGGVERDPRELKRVYNLGRACAIRKLQEVKEYLGQ